MGELISFLFATLFRPADELARLRHQPRPGAGFEALLLAGLSASALLYLLYSERLRPSRPMFFELGGDLYLKQAIAAPVALLAGWLIAVAVERFLAALMGGKGSARAAMGAVGLAMAVPLLFAGVVPMAVVYLRQGYEAMWPALAYVVPASVAWMAALLTLAVKGTEGLSTGSAGIIALVTMAVGLGPAVVVLT